MLKQKHGGLAIAGSKTVNRAAEIVKENYIKELHKFTLRNKFTIGAIKLYPSKPQRKSGEFRKLDKINAIVAVRKMKGGKDHYLKAQEDGHIKGGSVQTAGKVAIPLDAARTSKSHNKPIQGALQLQKSTIQSLPFGGYSLGVNDPFSNSKRWAILHKYKKSGKWDLKKQFFFTGINKGLGIFRQVGSRFQMVRTLEKTSVKIKPTHKFRKATNRINSIVIEKIFMRIAKKMM